MINEKLLVINPGSTSTKIAVYEGNNPKWTNSISHSLEELKQYSDIYDQLEMRTNMIRASLEEHGDNLDSLGAIVSRGGNMPPVSAGAYEINNYMVECLKYRPIDQHAANLGAGIALIFAREAGIKAYIYDALTVDEMLPVNTITGLKGVRRPARGHNLNTRAAALALCKEKGLPYDATNIIVAHLGGGITINLHSGGRIIDVIMDEEGPFSPERAGGLPIYAVVKMAFSGEYKETELMRRLQRAGGMISYFKTADMKEIEAMIQDRNEEACLIFEAMAMAVAKNIAKIAPVVSGKVDYIVLTGGLAHWDRFIAVIREKAGFLAPIEVIPGENEMQALADGALRVLRGEETAKILEP